MEESPEYIENLPPLLECKEIGKKKNYGKWEDFEPIVSIEHLIWAAQIKRMVWHRSDDYPKPAAFYLNWSVQWIDRLIKNGCFRLYKAKKQAK